MEKEVYPPHQVAPIEVEEMARTMVNPPCRSRRRPNGFTLIELLVVVSIIALLVSILMPALGKAKERAKIAVCASNQHQLAVAVHLYGSDYNGHLPGPPGYRANVLNTFHVENTNDCFLLYEYCGVPKAFYCPSSKFQFDTPVGSDQTYFRFIHNDGEWTCYLSYNCFISGQEYPGIYEDIPKKLDDPGSWVTWTDYDCYRISDGTFDAMYWQSNHPGNFGAYDERPPTNPERWGINVATLDGAVKWRNEGKTEDRYPIFGQVGIWWTRF